MHIDVRSVTVRFDSAPVVKAVDLLIADGAFTAIVGPNGSGKTTLLRTIYQAVRPTEGAVYIGGRDTRGLRPRHAAHLRAVVPQFQDSNIGLTVLDVVETGRYAHQAWWSPNRSTNTAVGGDALTAVGGEHLRDRMFDTLSGGERQRVLLARALAQQASALLLDEPTNHLDARAQLDLLDLVAGLSLTRVAVLHDLDHALAYADNVIVLNHGHLVATGAPSAVLTDELTRSVFGLRSAIMAHPLTGRPHLLTATDHSGGLEHSTDAG